MSQLGGHRQGLLGLLHQLEHQLACFQLEQLEQLELEQLEQLDSRR